MHRTHEVKPVLEVSLGILILAIGFVARNVSLSAGVYNCKDLFSLPLFLLNTVILLVIAYVLRNNEVTRSSAIAYVFVLSGGLGNLLERIVYICVYDYLVFLGVHFNLFDLFICVGLLILGFTYTAKKVK